VISQPGVSLKPFFGSFAVQNLDYVDHIKLY
jgi:hypothetical protein